MTIMSVPHPVWCDPVRCDAEVPGVPASGGRHRGAPQHLVVSLPAGDAVYVTAQLQLPGTAWFGGATRKRMTVEQAVDRSTAIAVQLNGGPVTLVPVDQARGLVERLAPLVGLTVTPAAVGGV